MKRVIKCSKCKKDFIQKYIPYTKRWSQISEISFWTDGKKWKNYRYFCRSCLKEWIDFEREKFNELVSSDKQRLLLNYKYRGTLDQNDHVRK